jgi:hypothetical protein
VIARDQRVLSRLSSPLRRNTGRRRTGDDRRRVAQALLAVAPMPAVVMLHGDAGPVSNQIAWKP